MLRYDPDEFTKGLVNIENQEVSYSDELDYCCNYAKILQQLQWKQPNGTTRTLVTIEVKDGVQIPENTAYRGYQDRPGSIKLGKS